jgi:hypothetical protein
MSYLYVKWNSSAVVCRPTVPPLKHVLGSLTTPAAEGVVSEQTCLDKNRMICHSIVEGGRND